MAENSGKLPPTPDDAADALRAVQEALASAGSGAAAPVDGPAAASAAQAALEAATQAVEHAAAAAGGGGPGADATPFPMPNFKGAAGAGGRGASGSPEGLDLLADVSLNVKIELGRTKMLVEDVLKLAQGSVVELDKLAGDPVDVYVNDRLVARGEVLVLNDNFCVRVNEIISAAANKAVR